MKYLRGKYGLTLVELMTASILVSVILLGVIGFSLTIQRFQSNNQKTAIVNIRLNSVFANLTHNIYQAIGNATDPAIILSGGGQRITMREDRNNPQTTDYSDDTWITYYILNNSLFSCVSDKTGTCSSGNEELLSNVETFQVTQASGTRLQIKISVLYDISQPFDPMKNPRYTLSGGLNSVLTSM
ncbi:MAG: hypothetical protein HQL25_04985 [Candidatus Omnitrophica bacterium]|nr:hypothetical protein [Candidatus Omnitrophota bacterium]